MLKGSGKSACKGIAIGPICLYEKWELVISQSLEEVSVEKESFHQAVKTAHQQLQVLYQQATRDIGKEAAAIIEVQQFILADTDFLIEIEERIELGESAAKAVQKVGERVSTTLEAVRDEYMQARGVDVRDVVKRVGGILSGSSGECVVKEPCILVATDLSPTEVIGIGKDKILAIVTKKGAYHSHTAILARMMHVPMLIQANLSIEESLQGKSMVVDACCDTFYVEPPEHIVREMEHRRNQQVEEAKELELYRGRKTITRSGKEVKLCANIGDAKELTEVLAGDAEGIGLFRSEFMYLGRSSFPTEEELYQAYHKVVSGMKGKKVVIRTLDMGGDKRADYLGLEREVNPALGYRGIRICLEQTELFRTQLRALYRASAYGKLAILFPMIISVSEVLACKELCEAVCHELEIEGVAVGEVELGVMIETPAGVLISEELAREVDFFSVGTNDLTQYTLAIDREHERLSALYDPYHPAIRKQLELVAKNGRREGIPVGICGELASDARVCEELVHMGYSEFSMPPSNILKIRKSLY